MNRLLIATTGALISLVAAGCGSDGRDDSEASEHELRRRSTPIPQVAQYAGTFEALDARHGDFMLEDDGSFVWEDGVANDRISGRYTGPWTPTLRPGAPVVLNTETLLLEITEGPWTEAQGASAVLVIKFENERTVEFASRYRLAGAAECIESGGRYDDVDLDRTTGLKCVCSTRKEWRHAANGCRE